MASSTPPDPNSSSSDASARKALPFEPKKRLKKSEESGAAGKQSETGANPKKAPKSASKPAVKAPSKPAPPKAKPSGSASDAALKKSAATRASMAIPDAVSKRMARRMAIFCGVPSFLAIATFVVSYYIVSQHLMDLPTSAVLLVSLGFFGLGVLGLSYGLFSASWEDEPGSLLGTSEFRTNLGRTIAAWRSQRPQS
ncbi:PAM68 family protein [Leptolyngbya sp. O-77]|uniref:PAM68 family protein n=1 Tax=Leptolyngbya sp. O-77 TaxID=1080068 RepID=UPI0009FF9B8A|nr:PAM68 family protein [Leptolyngbya sp. O-77]